MLVNANIEHNIRNAGYYGDYAVDNNEGRHRIVGIDKSEYSERRERNADYKLHPSEAGTPFHSFSPPLLRMDMNSSPVMVSFS